MILTVFCQQSHDSGVSDILPHSCCEIIRIDEATIARRNREFVNNPEKCFNVFAGDNQATGFSSSFMMFNS